MAYTGVNKASTEAQQYSTKANGLTNAVGIAANTAFSIGQEIIEEKHKAQLQSLNNDFYVEASKQVSAIQQTYPAEEWEKEVSAYYDTKRSEVAANKALPSSVRKAFASGMDSQKAEALGKVNAAVVAENARFADASFKENSTNLLNAPDTVQYLKQQGIIGGKGDPPVEQKEPTLENGFLSESSGKSISFDIQPKDSTLSVHSQALQEAYENGASDFDLKVEAQREYASRRYPNNPKMQELAVSSFIEQLREVQPQKDLETLFAANFKGKSPAQWNFNGFMDNYSAMLESSEYGGQKLSSYQKMELQKTATSLFEQYRAQESSRNNELFKQNAEPDLDKLIATNGKLTTEEYLARLKESGADPYFFPEEHAKYLAYAHANEQKDLADQYVGYVTGRDFPGKADVIADLKAQIDPEYIKKAQTTINSVAKQMKERQTTDDSSQLLLAMQQSYLHEIGSYDYDVPPDSPESQDSAQEQAHKSVQDTILSLKNRLGETEYNKVKWKFDNWKENLAPKGQTFAQTDDPWIKGKLDEMASNASKYSNEEILSFLEQSKGHITKETYEKLNDTKQLDKFRNPVFVEARNTFQTDAKKLLGTSYYLLNKDAMFGQLAQECSVNGTNPNIAAGNLLKKYQEEAAYKKVSGLYDVISDDSVRDFTGIFGQGNDMQQFAKDSANGITDAFITDAAKQFFSSFQSMGAERTSKLSDDEVNTMIVGYFLGLDYTDGKDYAKKVKDEYAKAPDTVKNIVAKQSQYASLAMKSAQSYDTEVQGVLGKRQGYFLTPYGPGILGSEGMVGVPWVGDDGNRTWAVFGTKTVDGKQEIDPDKRLIVSKQDLSTLDLESNIEQSVSNYLGTMKNYGGHVTRGGLEKMFQNPGSLSFLKNLEQQEERYNATVNSLGKQKFILNGGEPDKYQPVQYKLVFNVNEYQKTGNIGDLVRLAKVTQ